MRLFIHVKREKTFVDDLKNIKIIIIYLLLIKIERIIRTGVFKVRGKPNFIVI